MAGIDRPLPGGHRATARRAPVRDARRRRPGPTILTLVLLGGVLVGAHTPDGAAVVLWLRGFLEFYVGVFCLLAATAAVVSGVVAAQRVVPIRFRILAQGAHRANALMAVGFLVAHIVLKVMEAHASVLDAVLPFVDTHGRVLYIGLGTVAGDLLVLVLAIGVLRGRFVANSRPWVWRTLHALAYVMWPISIVHGLLAGRPPMGPWVTWSYVICAIFVLIAATGRLPRLARDRRMLRARRSKPNGRTSSGFGPVRASAPAAPADDLPDEEFWTSLRAEAARWIAGTRR